jgi:hypothetical protein
MLETPPFEDPFPEVEAATLRQSAIRGGRYCARTGFKRS